MPTVSGFATDTNNAGVARTIRMYRRDTGAFLAETTSSAVDGSYSLTNAYAGEVQVVLLDDTFGVLENDMILRTTPL